MKSQGTAGGRFIRAIRQWNVWAAEAALPELGAPLLEDALSYLALLPERNRRSSNA